MEKEEINKTILIPVYSKIRMVNGQIVALVDDVLEVPKELLQEDDDSGN